MVFRYCERDVSAGALAKAEAIQAAAAATYWIASLALAMTMWMLWVRQINPTGKSAKSLSIPHAKNIPLSPSGKSVI